MDDLLRMFAAYTGDPRHGDGHVIPESCEAEVVATVTDPVTGRTHEITGHIDQARLVYDADMEREYIEVWDIKSGGRDKHPGDYARGYTLQLAAYTLGVHQTRPDWTGGRDARCGGVILLSQYPRTERGDPHPPSVMQPIRMSPVDAERILQSVAWMLTHLEDGIVPIYPGSHCAYCPGGSAPSCLELLSQLAP